MAIAKWAGTLYVLPAMANTTAPFRTLRIYLEMIKIEHSIFALPFALMGMMLGSLRVHQSIWPGWATFGLIVVAMVSSRSAAMAFNRIVDREFDAENARTAMRAIPAGLLSLRHANLFMFASIAIFIGASALLNPLALALSPVALLATLGYSLSKRFTWLCHFILGFSLGIAPAAAYIAVTGRLDPAVVLLTFAVMFWTAGFDIIYALQDAEFDRDHALRSIPAKFGRRNALVISRVSHVLAIGLLIKAGVVLNLGTWYWIGVALAAALLAYEQSLVKPDDLSRVNMAFFTLNGWVSVAVFVCTWFDRMGAR